MMIIEPLQFCFVLLNFSNLEHVLLFGGGGGSNELSKCAETQKLKSKCPR